MMWILLFSLIALTVISALAFYAFKLLKRVKAQHLQIQQAKNERATRIKESLQIIAKAMQNGDCNLSEGVIRLAMLLIPFGKTLQPYAAMYALYEVVKEMPIQDDYKNLAKQERMRLDLTRESAEAKFNEQIQTELPQFLLDVNALEGL